MKNNRKSLLGLCCLAAAAALTANHFVPHLDFLCGFLQGIAIACCILYLLPGTAWKKLRTWKKNLFHKV